MRGLGILGYIGSSSGVPIIRRSSVPMKLRSTFTAVYSYKRPGKFTRFMELRWRNLGGMIGNLSHITRRVKGKRSISTEGEKKGGDMAM